VAMMSSVSMVKGALIVFVTDCGGPVALVGIPSTAGAVVEIPTTVDAVVGPPPQRTSPPQH